jgi:superfamily II DNA/RNA helicase
LRCDAYANNPIHVFAHPLELQGIEAVISYDTPVYLKTYIHRIGRTARAGRPGCAYTLLRPEEVHHFKLMIKKAGSTVGLHRLGDAAALAEQHAGCASIVNLLPKLEG